MFATYDVWDTLIRRRCHPDEIKIFSWQKALLHSGSEQALMEPSSILRHRQEIEHRIGVNKRKQGFDDEYTINEVFTDFLMDIGKNLVSFEINLEKVFTYKDPKIEKKYPIRSYEKIAIISDFYMPEEQLREILMNHFPELTDTKLYVSCDLGYNKRSGRIFNQISIPKDWTHIGDNVHSDFARSIEYGAKAKLYLPRKENKKRRKYQKKFNQRLKNPALQNLPSQLKIAIGIVGFSSYLKSKPGPLVFLEREGIALKEMFDATRDIDPWDFAHKESTLLPVSRLSTFGASFVVNPIDAFRQLNSQYPEITLDKLIKSLNLSIPESVFYSENKGQKLTAEILKNDHLMRFIQNELSTTKVMLEKLVSQKIKSNNFTCVDIGWSGSIQDNLQRLLGKEFKVSGIYLALKQNASSRSKFGFIVNQDTENYRKLIHSVRPIEILFNSSIGSVFGYTEHLNGEIMPTRQNEMDCVPESFVNYKTEIVSLLPEASNFIKSNLLTIYEASEYLAQGLSEFLTMPSRKMLKEYSRSFHDESFGLGTVVNIRLKNKSILNFLRMFMKDRRALQKIYWQVGWPESLIFQLIKFLPPRWIINPISRWIWRVLRGF